MSDEGSCLHGSEDCEFGDTQELVLVERIMRVIGHFKQDERINPCPICLRDSMLAVAALLHLEAAKINGGGSGHTTIEKHPVDEAFIEAARERLNAVAQVVAGNVIHLKQ
jgi:hypothetical protein